MHEYGNNGALLAGHPEVGKVPGIEISSGSLGHGPSIGVGVALSGKLNKKIIKPLLSLVMEKLTKAVWELL